LANTLDLGQALGAAEDASIERLTLYIPSHDRDGRRFDPQPWIDEALGLLARIGGGATAMLPADGAWLNPATDRLVVEKVVPVYTFIDPDRFEQQLGALRRFLHRLGRETNQGEVVCEFEGQLFKLRDFDQGEDNGSVRLKARRSKAPHRSHRSNQAASRSD
jgi:hypothetical protein